MKFAVSSGELLSRLQTVGKVITGKSPVPILENFLFTLEGDQLTIVGSDKEITIETALTVVNDGGDGGRVAVPSPRLMELLKKLPEQPVTFTINKDTSAIEISTSSGKYNQVGLSANDYPAAPSLTESARHYDIEAEVLMAGLSKTSFATANDDLRPVMNGILVDIDNEYTTFVATDSHKLVRYIRSDVKAGFQASFVLNKKPVAMLKNILGKNDGTIKIIFDDKNALIRTPNYTLQCLLINSQYPQYRSVIPANNPFRITVNRQDLLNSIGRAKAYADASSLVKLEISSNSIRLSTQDLDFSCSAYDMVPCQYEGSDMSIGFKSVFFEEVLSNMSATDIVIELSDPSRAGLILPAEKLENEDELMLLMPMKI